MAIALQLAGLWLFSHGMATGVFHFIPGIEVIRVADKPVPAVRPPEPALQKPVLPAVPKPDFTVAPTDKAETITATNLAPATDKVPPQPNIAHAAVGILATHTVPPYPPIARRLGL